MAYVRMTFVQATFPLMRFVHGSNIWAVRPNFDQTFWTLNLLSKIFSDQNVFCPKIFGTKFFLWTKNFFDQQIFLPTFFQTKNVWKCCNQKWTNILFRPKIFFVQKRFCPKIYLTIIFFDQKFSPQKFVFDQIFLHLFFGLVWVSLILFCFIFISCDE